jgi:uncharacterized protein (DUF58 family)
MNTEELLKKIRRIEIKTKSLTKNVFSGEYHSSFKGRGMAFSEVRDYQIGDEVRTIDWNVTARFNSPFVKVFEEERELTVMLLIDLSNSTIFGSGSKLKKEFIIELVAVLAFSAEANNDKVGAIFFTDKVEKYIKPSKGKKHILFLIRELIEFKTTNSKTDINEALRYFRNTAKKRSISFVLSDFFVDDNFIDSFRITKKKHEIIALKVGDKLEYELPDLGKIQMQHAESDFHTWVDTNNELVKEKYKENYLQHKENIAKEFKKNGIDYAYFESHMDYIPTLIKLFSAKK